jgi:hypothetical protein
MPLGCPLAYLTCNSIHHIATLIRQVASALLTLNSATTSMASHNIEGRRTVECECTANHELCHYVDGATHH